MAFLQLLCLTNYLLLLMYPCSFYVSISLSELFRLIITDRILGMWVDLYLDRLLLTSIFFCRIMLLESRIVMKDFFDRFFILDLGLSHLLGDLVRLFFFLVMYWCFCQNLLKRWASLFFIDSINKFILCLRIIAVVTVRLFAIQRFLLWWNSVL